MNWKLPLSNLVFITYLLIGLDASAQAPDKMSYQAVIRDGSNTLVVNKMVGMRISIIQGTATGTAVFVETHTPRTNANGLVGIEIGGGAQITGTFANLNWANGPYFVKTETDPTGGTNYTITGTSQLLSVPYALHAKTADTVPGSFNGDYNNLRNLPDLNIINTDNQQLSVSNTGDTLKLQNGGFVIIPGLSAANNPIGIYPTGTVHCNGIPTAVVDVTNPITGKTWMDRNLGASRAATSSTDAQAYGDLYQWGRRADGHQCRNSLTTSTLSSTDQPSHGNFITVTSGNPDWRNPQNPNLWQGVNGVNNPCPIGYRLPTETELNTERQSWNSNNAAGAFASPLKFTVAGNRNNSGSLDLVGIGGYYWNSTIINNLSRLLDFFGSNAYIVTRGRPDGLSVRCIKD